MRSLLATARRAALIAGFCAAPFAADAGPPSASGPRGAAAGANGDITGLNILSTITPPASASYRVNTIGGHLITANDTLVATQATIAATAMVSGNSYKIVAPNDTNWTAIGAANGSANTIFKYNGVTVTGSGTVTFFAPPFQGFRLNYTSTQNWPTDITGSVALSAISMSVSGNSGATYGKGVIGWNVAMQPKAGYDGHELYADGASIILNDALNTTSDLVARSSGVTLNNTTESAGAWGSHTYVDFATANFNSALVQIPIAHLFHGEMALVSGAQVTYLNGSHVEKNGSAPESGESRNAGLMNPHNQYVISTPGNTDWVSLGAADNNQGTVFIANSSVSGNGFSNGTGIATAFPWSSAFSVSAAGIGGKAQAFLNAFSFEDVVPHIGTVLPQSLRPEGAVFAYDNQTVCSASGPITLPAHGPPTTGGSGYLPASGTLLYTLVPLLGGTGTGSYANITVTDGAVTNVVILTLPRGAGYTAGDILTADAANLGGSGSGFTYTVPKTNPTCPMTLANLIKFPNIYFSDDIINVTDSATTKGWRLDTAFKEQIASLDLYDLNNGVIPNTANDLVITGVTSRNAGAAVPPISLPASNCGTMNDGCWLLRGGLNSNPISGVNIYVPWYYNPPDGSQTIKGDSKAVGSSNGALDLSIGHTTVTGPNCGGIGASTGAFKCLSWYIGSSLYYVPVGLASAPVVPQYLPNTNSGTPTLNNLNLTSADISGATNIVNLNMTGALAAGAALKLPGVTTLIASMAASFQVTTAGASYELDIANSSGSAFNWTVTTNTGWTLVNTMTIAPGTVRKFTVTFTSASTATITSTGAFTLAGSI